MPQKQNKEQRVGISVRRLLPALIPIFFAIAIRNGNNQMKIFAIAITKKDFPFDRG